jgi:5-oxoprolinase (ATP-hydrolysing) subunit A
LENSGFAGRTADGNEGEITSVFADRPHSIDLNADVGEGMGQDEELLPFVTSANIACGIHAGDPTTMSQTVQLARAHGVAVGAHPSYPDRAGFGRRAMVLTEGEVEGCVSIQVRALAEIAAIYGVALRHVKPHGAMYNVAAQDLKVANAIARAVAALDPSLVLVGLAGSALIEAGRRAGLRTANEVFADRGYRADGSLVPRGEPGDVLHDPDVVVPRAVVMVREGAVIAVDGARVELPVETLCVHGDTRNAAALAARLNQGLLAAGIALGPPA